MSHGSGAGNIRSDSHGSSSIGHGSSNTPRERDSNPWKVNSKQRSPSAQLDILLPCHTQLLIRVEAPRPCR